jgi:superfamily II DNA/RNA helicase
LTSGTNNLQDEVDRLSSNDQDRDDPFISMDILIATPGRLFSSLKNKDVSLDRTLAVILDEADVLFLDESFPLQGIGSYLPTVGKDRSFAFQTL